MTVHVAAGAEPMAMLQSTPSISKASGTTTVTAIAVLVPKLSVRLNFFETMVPPVLLSTVSVAVPFTVWVVVLTVKIPDTITVIPNGVVMVLLKVTVWVAASTGARIARPRKTLPESKI